MRLSLDYLHFYILITDDIAGPSRNVVPSSELSAQDRKNSWMEIVARSGGFFEPADTRIRSPMLYPMLIATLLN